MNNSDIERIALANGFKLKTQPDGSEALNPYVFDFARALLSAAPTPPEVGPVGYQFRMLDRMGIWTICSMSEYEMHSVDRQIYETRKLYTSPPSPKASWDADGNPLTLEAAAWDVLKPLEVLLEWKTVAAHEALTAYNNLRKFLPEGK